MMHSRSDAGILREMLLAARARTLLLSRDLGGERLLGPRLAIVNPPLWEFGHVGWFQEHWCLRWQPDAAPASREQGSRLRDATGRESGAAPSSAGVASVSGVTSPKGAPVPPSDGALAPSILENADELYNSATVPHATRWDLPLPDFDATLAYLQRVLERVLERIDREGATEHLTYFVQLAVFHEEMHCEAFTYTRQTLGYPASESARPAGEMGTGAWPGDVEISGGRFMLGATADDGFVFDNEKWAHEVEVKPFRIARAAVTNADFTAFVDDGGYRRQELWSAAGWRWRSEVQAEHPVYWIKGDGGWLRRRYDEVVALPLHAPMIHVNWFEADAYCRWAGRRLPSEAEWEFAAATAPGAPEGKRRYPWGDGAPSPARANLYGEVADCVDVVALPQGDSAWGCRQMFGNVWEWTADWFGPYPGFVRDPYKEYSEPWFGDHKVLRGGCFATRASLLRNTWRNFYTPDRRDIFAGFRTCVP